MQYDDQPKLKWCPDCQEEIEVTEGQNTCPHCGGVLEDIPGEEDLFSDEEKLDKEEEVEEVEGQEGNFEPDPFQEGI